MRTLIYCYTKALQPPNPIYHSLTTVRPQKRLGDAHEIGI